MAEPEHDLQILEAIEGNPDLTQANLATQLGVAVGRVNWYFKRLMNKGYIKVTHLQRRKLHYFLTPSGIARKVELTQGYMQASLRVYRELRHSAQEAIAEVCRAGYTEVHVEGKDEASEILCLTCLEQGIKMEKESGSTPAIRANGVGFVITWPGADGEGQGQQGE
jgi:DNA-binding MarR family transcriptional regulator